MPRLGHTHAVALTSFKEKATEDWSHSFPHQTYHKEHTVYCLRVSSVTEFGAQKHFVLRRYRNFAEFRAVRTSRRTAALRVWLPITPNYSQLLPITPNHSQSLPFPPNSSQFLTPVCAAGAGEPRRRRPA
eukprot:SAG31_NODE_25370_length_462_cov_1.275482_2_plen_130_part_01